MNERSLCESQSDRTVHIAPMTGWTEMCLMRLSNTDVTEMSLEHE